MRELRLNSLKVYNSISIPSWGPDISEVDIKNIVTYIRPDTDMKHSWEEVPSDIKKTFDLLGIPKAEKESLAGVGAQYDSEVVYHSIREDLVKQGVVYTDMETAVREYEGIVKKYFMKCVPPKDHKFAALHGAVWSGGSFVYVPKGVKIDIPLQSYFRLKIGRISDDAIFYLMSRGISEDEAKAMIVRGFVEPIAKELPLEYAVEMNKLISLELEGAIG